MPDSFTGLSVSQHIIYEDNYLLAIDKPPGLSAEGSLGLAAFVKSYLSEAYPWKKQLIAGVVHRLDRPVGGLIIFAKTKMALKSLNDQFAKRSIDKKYLAVCENSPPEQQGILKHWLVKDQAARISRVVAENTNGAKPAHLRYEVLQTAGEHALVAIELLTGRYHQIRVQLAAAGCPIAGDGRYGGTPDPHYPAGIYLHSHSLAFHHPKSGERMNLHSLPPPTGRWSLFKLPL